jgi:hypothetical protein
MVNGLEDSDGLCDPGWRWVTISIWRIFPSLSDRLAKAGLEISITF